jgi:hypothetical protein
MKKFVLIICVAFACLQGCRKAGTTIPGYYCRNICFLCYQRGNYTNVDSFCNTDYTPERFQEKWFDDSLVGFICKEVQPHTFHELSGANLEQQVAAEEANRLTCTEKSSYHPSYFDYTAFVNSNIRCKACFDTIADHFLAIYFDTLIKRIGPLTQNPEVDGHFINDSLRGLVTFSSNQVSHMNCGFPFATKYAIPGYLSSLLREHQYDPVCDTCFFTTSQQKDSIVALNSWLDFNSGIAGTWADALIFSECR